MSFAARVTPAHGDVLRGFMGSFLWGERLRSWGAGKRSDFVRYRRGPVEILLDHPANDRRRFGWVRGGCGKGSLAGLALATASTILNGVLAVAVRAGDLIFR